jgi:hypothetical protein
MKSLLGLLLVCASCLVARADNALNTQGLPEGAVGVIQLNVTNFNETKVGQAIKDAIPDNQEAALLKQELGIEPSTDIKELIFGVYPGPDGKVAQKDPFIAGLIRGNFQPKQIESFAQSNGLRPKAIGNCNGWDIAEIQKALGSETAKKAAANEGMLLTGPTNALGFASMSLVERTVEALGQTTGTVKIPAGSEAYLAKAQKPWAFMAFDGTKMEDVDKAGIKTVTVVAGESPTHVQVGVYLQFKSKDLAADTANKIKGLQMMATLATSTSEEGKTAEQINQQHLVADLLQGIKVDSQDDLISINFEFPVDKAIQAIKAAIDKAQAQAQAGQATTPFLKVKKK